MSLEKIGQLAVDLHAATLARKHAKDRLRDTYAEFCREEGICDYDQDLRYVRNDHPAYADMQSYAAEEVKAYARAKLDEYNLKRKLRRAIESFGRDAQQDDAVSKARSTWPKSGILLPPLVRFTPLRS